MRFRDMTNCSYLPLPEVLSFIVDNRGKTVPTAETGIPLIATNCIKNNELYPVFEKIRYLSEDTYKNWFRAHPIPGDIIFVNKGAPGTVCMVPDPVRFCIAQDMMAFRVNEKIINNKYLFSVLRSSQFQTQIEQFHVGTLIPHFKKGDLDKLLIPIPSMNVQKFIGETYYELCSKIELNNRINKTLEEMAQAIFKSWFVDFEPFQDGEFEESELGRIPRGWRVGCVEEIITQKINVCRIENINNGSRYIGLEHIPRKNMVINDSGTIEDVSSDKLRFEKFQILFGKIRPYFHKVSIAPWDGYCSTDAIVLAPKSEEFFSYAALTVFSDQFVQFSVQISHGTKMPRSDWKTLKSYKIVLPPLEIVISFNEIVKLYIDKMLLNCEENNRLTSIRDSLLPKLMSGEIRVTPPVTT